MKRRLWIVLCLAFSTAGLVVAEASDPPGMDATMDELAARETWGLIHDITGYATLAASTASMVVGLAAHGSIPHQVLEYSTLGLVTVTLAIGFFNYYERMPLANPERPLIHPDTLHTIFGILGAGLTYAAFLTSDKDLRNGLRIGSTAFLAASILMELK